MGVVTSTYKRLRPVQQTCRCKAYPFPHRAGSGVCRGDEPGPFCGSCGEPCEAETADFGVGEYEFWGFRGVDRNVQTVSSCCEADLYSDAELSVEYVEDDDYDPY